MQITAELDPQHIEKLQTLEKILKKNTSELISLAIDEIFTKNSDLIGCAEVAISNDQTKIALLDVRARKNLENLTLEQLQREVEAQ